MRSPSLIFLALTVAIVAPACRAGPGADPPSASPDASDPTTADLRYSCGSQPFALDLLAEPATAEREDHPAAAALRTFLATPNMDSDFLPDSGWLLAGRDERVAEYVAEVGGQPPFVSVGLENQGDSWRVTGWGQCTPQLVFAGGVGTATWRAAEAIGPATLGFTALVTEMSCASGRPAVGRVVGPGIVYGGTEVLVAFGVRRLGGAQTCPSNPETEVAVELREPLGERALLDAGVFPPREPGAP